MNPSYQGDEQETEHRDYLWRTVGSGAKVHAVRIGRHHPQNNTVALCGTAGMCGGAFQATKCKRCMKLLAAKKRS